MDSSIPTVALPPPPRPLKRSASTASLPTPPRTHHKGKHRRSRRNSRVTDSSTEEEGGHSDGTEVRSNAVLTDSVDEGGTGENGGLDDAVNKGLKKRRTSETKDSDAEEDAFWLGDAPPPPAAAGHPVKKLKQQAKSESSSPAHPLLYRRLRTTASGTVRDSSSSVAKKRSRSTKCVTPVSPPPSNRRVANKDKASLAAIASSSTLVATASNTPDTAVASVSSLPPITPEPRPARDSPNNPFLVDSPAPGGLDSPEVSSIPEPRTPLQEKPTVTYVFRGVRGTFPNPLYDHRKNRPRSPSANSRLPLDHPDYSPDILCPPKLLFPTTHKPGRGRQLHHNGSVRITRSVSPSPAQGSSMALRKRNNANKASALRREALSSGAEDDTDVDGPQIPIPMPKKIDFGAAAGSFLEEKSRAGSSAAGTLKGRIQDRR